MVLTSSGKSVLCGIEHYMTSVELTIRLEDVNMGGRYDEALGSWARLATLKKLARVEYLGVSYSLDELATVRAGLAATLTFLEQFHDFLVVLDS